MLELFGSILEMNKAILGAALFAGALAVLYLLQVSKRLLLRYALTKAYKGKDKLALFALKMLGGGNSTGLLEMQDKLPRLPLPPLKKTLHKWLASVKPLITRDQYEDAKVAVEEFENSEEAKMLQQELKHRYKTMPNWLTDWWIEFAYLRQRGPLPTGSNFYSTDQYENMFGDVCTPDPVRRAADLIVGHLDFKQHVDEGRKTCQKIGGVVPVCMEGFPLVHGTTRVPGEECDKLRTVVVPPDGDAHVLLMVGSTMFKLPVQIKGKRATAGSLEAAIRIAVNSAKDAKPTKYGSGAYAQPNVSLLTTRERSKWAKHRTLLICGSSKNCESMDVIEEALFTVVMHDLETDCPKDNRVMIREAMHGDGTRMWYDKCFNLIVFKDSRVAWHYEHTYADAPVPGCAVEHALVASNPRVQHLRIHPEPQEKRYERMVHAEMLEWNTDCVREFDEWVSDATREFAELTSSIACGPVNFYDFGINHIKAFKVSPDSFCQAALQVASLRYFGRHVLTYESASLRAFQRGRTETIRSATAEMTAFARAFVGNEQNKPGGRERMQGMLREASAVHSRVSKEASAGEGFDRHMLAIKLAALTTGMPPPRVFETDAWKLEFELVTSQSPILQEHHKAAPTVMTQGGGFGPTSDPGVGVSYHPQRERIYFHVSVKSKSPAEDQERFSQYLKEAVTGMRTLFDS
uniref:Choline/carnitine acyltransferase domain-containing protein n=1 Tax=Hemiselmis andersenii TaxID=464988 RepID=A0A6U5BTD4_HEMAN|mmetsp:Transcript_33248/g.77773  ORF Transcript_33248/g.77773 Transcript_33248/m.77773 type:complete len:690 (-) Transcript_33248:255-2324(-)